MGAAPYRYIIVGGGLAGCYAVEGIRQIDGDGTILLIGSEPELPYDRPPLTKGLWFGKKTEAQIYVHDAHWYRVEGVQLAPGTTVTHLDPGERVVTDQKGTPYGYESLLLATGGHPRRLEVPGADLEGVCHYRYLSDYRHLREQAVAGYSAVVIGGGFIGSEIAAALSTTGVTVTMLFPSDHLMPRVFPADLAAAVQADYQQRGIAILPGERVAAIAGSGNRLAVHTEGGRRIDADTVVVGVGIEPEVRLPREAGLDTNDGITVSEYLGAALPDIYAAGDVARFPYHALGRMARVEHWDNAIEQGRLAGRNMAGAAERYDHLPYFFSDLFDLGYEAVGDTNPRLALYCDWQQEFRTGVLYYLEDRVVKGVLLCNVWGKVEEAREIIRRREAMTSDDLHGAIDLGLPEAA